MHGARAVLVGQFWMLISLIQSKQSKHSKGQRSQLIHLTQHLDAL
jgi:hypothetical protein